MADLLEMIRERRTIHRFKDLAIDEKIILDALQFASYAPNHHLNPAARYRLISAQTKDALLALAQKKFEAKNPENAQAKVDKWRKTPGWMMVTQVKSSDDKTLKEDYASIACGLYILMLKLAEQGIGSKWSTGSIIFSPEWKSICNIDSNEEVVGLFWYGYADGEFKMPPRSNIEAQILRI